MTINPVLADFGLPVTTSIHSFLNSTPILSFISAHCLIATGSKNYSLTETTMSQNKRNPKPTSGALHLFEKHDDENDLLSFALTPAVFVNPQRLDDKDQEDSSEFELEEERPPQPNIEGNKLWSDIEGHFHLNKWKSDELITGQPVTCDTLETLFSIWNSEVPTPLQLKMGISTPAVWDVNAGSFAMRNAGAVAFHLNPFHHKLYFIPVAIGPGQWILAVITDAYTLQTDERDHFSDKCLIVTFDGCGATELARLVATALESMLLESIGSPASHAPIIKINTESCTQISKCDSAIHVLRAATQFLNQWRVLTFDWSSTEKLPTGVYILAFPRFLPNIMRGGHSLEFLRRALHKCLCSMDKGLAIRAIYMTDDEKPR